MLYVLLASVYFGKKPLVSKSTKRLAESILYHRCLVPWNPCCTVTFAGQNLAHKKLLAIQQNDLPIGDVLKILCLFFQWAGFISPKRVGDLATVLASLSAIDFLCLCLLFSWFLLVFRRYGKYKYKYVTQ